MPMPGVHSTIERTAQSARWAKILPKELLVKKCLVPLCLFFFSILLSAFGNEVPKTQVLERVFSDQILKSIKKFAQCEATLQILECEITPFAEFKRYIYDPEFIITVDRSDFHIPIYITFPMPLINTLLDRHLLRYDVDGESFRLLNSREKRIMRVFVEDILNNAARQLKLRRNYFGISQITFHPQFLNRTNDTEEMISFLFEIRIPGEKWGVAFGYPKK